MNEFFIAVFVAFPPAGGGLPIMKTASVVTYEECVSINKAELKIEKVLRPSWTDFRTSCIPTEKIGQNSV